MSRDPFEALDALLELGVDRLLSSGQEAHVLEGLDLLAELVRRAGDRLLVMPGCGVTPRNALRVVERTGARELHIVGTEPLESPMRYRNPRCFMGTELRSPEFGRAVTTRSKIHDFVTALRP